MTIEEADISPGRKFSGIWMIPILALVLGIYMVIDNMMNEGPEISIAFTTANGLEQGKTKVKYRDVEMGTVQEVRLNDKFDGVIAKVKLDRQALPLLRTDTRFWVVTARVGVDNISGLDTLLSGAYLQLAPGTGEEGERDFIGLDHPPLTPAGAPGLRLNLTSDHVTSVSAGDTVLYKGYKVGRVETMKFDPADKLLHYQLFIDAPFHELVNSSVRFWDASGVSVSMGADGLNVRTGSVESILFGGVSFGMPEGVKEGEPVAANTDFKLYASYADILENPFAYGTYFVVSFKQSIKGLLPGAPVEFRGIQVGKVDRVMLKEGQALNVKTGIEGEGAPIPVLIYIEPGRMALPDKEESIPLLRKGLKQGIAKGMRASLESGNLLTGAKYISIDFYPDSPPATEGMFLEYATIPTIETGLAQLAQSVNSILHTIDELPLADTVAGANTAIATLNQSLVGLQAIMENQSTQQLPVQLDQTLRELREAISSLSPSSEAYQSLNSSLLSLNRTMSNLESLTRTLAEQPNAVLISSDPVPDTIPEVSE
ncbi:MAG: intermembrane transport protein PqiB [Halioglobus sp.]|nr:intermembrane transport protein PqiB [Halioglobus sp.]